MSQQPVSINLTEKDGLLDSEIYSILEDNQGYVWLAGNKGLLRYNGKDFEVFSHPKKQGRSFFNLKLDAKGRVWCNNIAGQFFFIENDELKLFGNYQQLLKGALTDFSFLNNNLVLKVYKKGNLLRSLILIDLDTKKELITKTKTNGSSIGINLNNTLYYYNKDCRFAYIKEANQIPKIIPSSIGISTKGFTAFSACKNGFVFTRSDRNHVNTDLFIVNDSIYKITLPRALSKLRIENISNYNNSMYFATSNGVYVCEIKNRVISIKSHYKAGLFITKAIVDTNKNLWLSTLNKGVFVIPNESLKTINSNLKVTQLLKKNDSICYVATKSGKLYTLNNNNQKLKLHSLSNSNSVRGIAFYKNKLVFATDSQFTINDESNFTSTNLPLVAGVKSVDIIEDDIFLLSVSHSTLIKKLNSEIRLTDKRSYKSIYSKKNKKIYVSDVDGLKVYDTNFNFEKELKYNKKPIYAFDITESKNGAVWVATYDKGVFKIENDEVYNQLNVENGLASNITNSIKADGNNLWIATEAGLQFYNSKTKKFKTISKQDGLNSYSINQIEIFDETVLFSSNLGLFSFNKEDVFKTRNISKPYYTQVNIQEKDTLISDNYTLKQTESSISFQFNTKGFQSSKSSTYQYKLEGLNDDWVSVENSSDYVKFTTLPAGNFNFRLRVKDKFSDKISEADSVKLRVVLPFYKRWWFLGLLFFMSLVSVIYYFKSKTERLKNMQKTELEKAQISKDLVFSQLENLRSQMNPHFIFNALNSIQDYIITNEKKLARQYLVKFSRLIRIYLEHSQKNEISLSEELKALKLYLQLEKDRFENGFIYNVEVDEKLNPEVVFVPSLLVQPYVENALKHGLLHKKNNKELNIIFSESEDKKNMVCTVIDNGIGRVASAKINAKRRQDHDSFATTANQKRIDLININKQRHLTVAILDLYNKQEQPTGTKVVIHIPI